jgi:hypothetical protein
MNCRAFKQMFSFFLEGELEPRVHAQAQAHLKGCGKCSRLVEAHRTGVRLLLDQPEIDPPENLFDLVRAAAADRSRPAPLLPVRPFRRPLFYVPATVAAAAVMAISFFFNSENGTPVRLENYVLVDSTMDVVNFQVAEQLAYQENEARKAGSGSARLASYAGIEDEAVLSYGASRTPVIIQSGVSTENTE